MSNISLPNLNSNKLLQDRNRILQQLQHFRQRPTQMDKYLTERMNRYRNFEGVQYLVSKRHRKKAIQVHQKEPSKNRIGELIGILFGQKGQSTVMQRLQPVPKLDQIAFKLCQTIYPNMRQPLVFKPNTSQYLRQLLDNDPQASYPTPVSCLVSLGFDEPYEDLINLLIDDGVPSRANRRQLFNPNLKYVGVSSINTEMQPELRCTVYVLTQNIIPKQGNQIPQQNYSNPAQNNIVQTNFNQNIPTAINNPPQNQSFSNTSIQNPVPNNISLQNSQSYSNAPLQNSQPFNNMPVQNPQPQNMQTHMTFMEKPPSIQINPQQIGANNNVNNNVPPPSNINLSQSPSFISRNSVSQDSIMDLNAPTQSNINSSFNLNTTHN